MIKARTRDNFNKIITWTELTDVIVKLFFWREFSKKHNGRFSPRYDHDVTPESSWLMEAKTYACDLTH